MDIPSLEIELALCAQGHRLVAGLDEVGRGAWAGPVVAAAVIIPLDRPDVEYVLAGDTSKGGLLRFNRTGKDKQ